MKPAPIMRCFVFFISEPERVGVPAADPCTPAPSRAQEFCDPSVETSSFRLGAVPDAQRDAGDLLGDERLDQGAVPLQILKVRPRHVVGARGPTIRAGDGKGPALTTLSSLNAPRAQVAVNAHVFPPLP